MTDLRMETFENVIIDEIADLAHFAGQVLSEGIVQYNKVLESTVDLRLGKTVLNDDKNQSIVKYFVMFCNKGSEKRQALLEPVIIETTIDIIGYIAKGKKENTEIYVKDIFNEKEYRLVLTKKLRDRLFLVLGNNVHIRRWYTNYYHPKDGLEQYCQ